MPTLSRTVEKLARALVAATVLEEATRGVLLDEYDARAKRGRTLYRLTANRWTVAA